MTHHYPCPFRLHSSPVPPASVPEAELEIETPRFVVRVRIRGTKCRLIAPDIPELKRLLEAPGMGAGCLIMELEHAGKLLYSGRGETNK